MALVIGLRRCGVAFSPGRRVNLWRMSQFLARRSQPDAGSRPGCRCGRGPDPCGAPISKGYAGVPTDGRAESVQGVPRRGSRRTAPKCRDHRVLCRPRSGPVGQGRPECCDGGETIPPNRSYRGWSLDPMLCGSHGVAFSPLRVLAWFMRTTPMARQDISVGRRDWIFCRRASGRYTIARRNVMHTPHEPGSLRLLPQLGRLFPRHRRALKSRLDHWFPAELRNKRRGVSDEAALFEAARAGSGARLRGLQVVAGMQVAGQWGGMIDVTCESVSVIDQANSVMGTPARVDPGPFRSARFSRRGAL